MKILVNDTTIDVVNAYPERETATRIINLYIHISQSVMEYADIKTLFKSNTGDIVKTDDEGNEEIWTGFEYVTMSDDDANNVYIVHLKSDEFAFQLGRNQQLEKDNAAYKVSITNKNKEIETLNQSITEKDTIIETKTSEIATLNTSIEEKSKTILEQTNTIKELNDAVETKDATILEKEATISQQAASITELETSINEKDATILEKEATINEQAASITELETFITVDVDRAIEEGVNTI